MSHLEQFAVDCRRIREQSPIILNITNYVAMGISANALLGVGASPLMSSEPEEMKELTTLASAVAINLGCLESTQIKAMDLAAETAAELGRPWVLDPVGFGASRLRNCTAMRLAEQFHPSVIRGNASEIMAMAGAAVRPHGVDTADCSNAAAEYAVTLARRLGTVVSVSGPVDIITDGRDIVRIYNGDPMMPKVSALGCTASAITAAFLAADSNALDAAAGAMALMGIAGEQAAAASAGPGSLPANFIDALHSISPDDEFNRIRYEQESA